MVSFQLLGDTSQVARRREEQENTSRPIFVFSCPSLRCTARHIFHIRDSSFSRYLRRDFFKGFYFLFSFVKGFTRDHQKVYLSRGVIFFKLLEYVSGCRNSCFRDPDNTFQFRGLVLSLRNVCDTCCGSCLCVFCISVAHVKANLEVDRNSAEKGRLTVPRILR